MSETSPSEAAPVAHMSPEEFRRHGHALIDWISDYLATVDDRPVRASVEPGEIRAMVDELPPEAPEPFEKILADIDRVVMPGVSHWQHPGWYAFFPASSSPPSILGELLSAGLGVQGMMWATSPACTEIENVTLDWLVDLLGLPPSWRIDTGPGGGVIQMSASDSTHIALVVARHRATEDGLDPTRLVAYGSAQAHSSIAKGARIAGFHHVRAVDVDGDFAMSAPALAEAIDDDRAAGLHPTWVCSTVGTTGTTAVDPVPAVADIATRAGLWHHVDAAYAGAAMICPELRHHQEGLELVDSYVANPHKWLLTNFDCSAFYVADRAALVDTLRIDASYLANPASASGDVVDYRDWHVSLGRRFRALKLWWVLRAYGAEALRRHVRAHIAWASELADRLDADARFEIVAPHPFSLVCFAHAGGDEQTRRLADALNDSGRAYLTVSEAGGRSFIRVAIGSTWTQRHHVDELWALIDELAAS